MGPVDAIRSGFQRAVDFRGRSTRPEYWWWYLFAAIAALLLGEEVNSLERIAALALSVPTLAVAVRRLHDVDRSAWNMLWALLPVLGGIVLLIRFLQPGTPASNRYGPPPPGTVTADDPGTGWDAPPPTPPVPGR